ncbi:MAG: substrate-binding domain-containing protein [Chloroflexi bacterium]|nr:substrate-binding domain-containing protein [Chloroflexota bacterium]
MSHKRPIRLVAVFCLLLTLLLAACGDATSTAPAAATTAAGSATTAAAASATTAAAASGTKYKIALVLGSSTDSFYTSMQCGAQEEARKLGDVDLTVQGAQTWDATLQIPIINALIANKVQALAVVVNDPKALFAPLKTASDAGVKVMGVDTKLDDTSFEVTNISSDNKALGVVAAKTMAGLINDKGAVALPALPPGVSTVSDRITGFREEMKANHPNITLVELASTSTGSNEADGTVAAINAAFVAHSDLVGIYATNSTISDATVAALKGLPADKQQSVKVVGFDATPTSVAAMQAGKVQALVAQKPAQMGALAVDNARKALMGQQVDKVIPVDGVGLTAQNVTDPNFSQYVYKSSC